MGNTHSNRVEDHRRRQETSEIPQHIINLLGNEQQQNQVQMYMLPQNSISSNDHHRPHAQVVNRPSDNSNVSGWQVAGRESNLTQVKSSGLISLKNQKQNFNFRSTQINAQRIDCKDQTSQVDQPPEIGLITSTWYRDSHGLFDYEEEQKLTVNQFKTNKSFLLKRHGDSIVKEEFTNYSAMKMDQKYLSEMVPPPSDFKKSVATCYLKKNNYWIYHKQTVEDAEEEKALPGEKLWLVMKHMSIDKDHNFQPGEGYKLDIGDTIKFGRVRYKVTMMHNEIGGLREYNLNDRFQKYQYYQGGRRHDGKGKSKQSPRRHKSRRSPRSNRSGSQRSEAADRQSNLPRYQSQITQYDQNLDLRNSFVQNDDYDENFQNSDDSFGVDDSNESMSQGEESSSNYNTDSQVINERRPYIDQPDDAQSSASFYDQNDEINHQTAAVRNGIEPNFVVGRFNSIVPEIVNSRQQAAGGITNATSDNNLDLSRNQRTNNEFGRQLTDNLGIHNAINDRQSISPFIGQGGTNVSGFLSINQDGFQSHRRITAHGHGLPRGTNSLSNINLIATQTNLHDDDLSKKRRKKISKKISKQDKQKKKRQMQAMLKEQAQLAMEGKVCRICLGEENVNSDPLISPCKCAGTMSHIHLECLREWLNSKRSKKEGENVSTYCWKSLECELCKVRFPGQVYSDGHIVTDKDQFSYKQMKKMGKPIEILDYDRPEKDFLVLESVTLQNIRIVHVINMVDRPFIRVGRGHDADIRVTDISVSRFHAKINRSEKGEYFVEDNKSKFGTLIQIRKPYNLEKNKTNYLQMGRTMLQLRINDKSESESAKKSSTSMLCQVILCCKKQKAVAKGIKEMSNEIYPKEWDPEPVHDPNENASDKQLNTQVAIENTRDEDQVPNASQQSMRVEQAQNNNDNSEQQNQSQFQSALVNNTQQIVSSVNEEEKVNNTQQPGDLRAQRTNVQNVRDDLPRDLVQSALPRIQLNDTSNILGHLNPNSSDNLGDETMRASNQIHHVVQERNPIIIEDPRSNMIQMEARKDETTQKSIEVDQNINQNQDQTNKNDRSDMQTINLDNHGIETRMHQRSIDQSNTENLNAVDFMDNSIVNSGNGNINSSFVGGQDVRARMNQSFYKGVQTQFTTPTQLINDLQKSPKSGANHTILNPTLSPKKHCMLQIDDKQMLNQKESFIQIVDKNDIEDNKNGQYQNSNMMTQKIGEFQNDPPKLMASQYELQFHSQNSDSKNQMESLKCTSPINLLNETNGTERVKLIQAFETEQTLNQGDITIKKSPQFRQSPRRNSTMNLQLKQETTQVDDMQRRLKNVVEESKGERPDNSTPLCNDRSISDQTIIAGGPQTLITAGRATPDVMIAQMDVIKKQGDEQKFDVKQAQ